MRELVKKNHFIELLPKKIGYTKFVYIMYILNMLYYNNSENVNSGTCTFRFLR